MLTRDRFTISDVELVDIYITKERFERLMTSRIFDEVLLLFWCIRPDFSVCIIHEYLLVDTING